MAKEERPFIPPPRKPVSEFTTPVQTDGFYVEIVNRTDPAYVNNAPIKRGTLYSTIIGANQKVIDQFPAGLYFCKESRLGQSDQLVQWLWATDRNAEDTYNAEISYALESVTSPTYARTYTIRRDVYDNLPPITQGTPLTSLIGVKVTNGGSGYTFATGTIDTGAEVEFVISQGSIISGIVTVEGTGVSSTGSINITGDGSGAIAKAIIQPASAVLIGQKKQEFSEDHPLRNEFVRLTRIYETLPGPTINSTRIDKDGDVINVATTEEVAADIVSGETLATGTWTKVTEQQSDNVYTGKQIVETRVIPGNPMPTTRLDEDGIEVDIVVTFKDKTLVTTHETLITGVWTKTNAKDCTSEMGVSDLVVDEVVESRAIPGNALFSTRIDEDGKPVTVQTTLKDTTLITSQETLISGNWAKTSKKEVSDLVAQEIVETRVVPGNAVPSTQVDKYGDTVTVSKTLKDTTLITTGETLITGVWKTTTKEPVTDLVSNEVVKSQAIPSNTIASTVFDRDGVLKTSSEQLVGSSTVITSEVLSGGNVLTRKYGEAVSDLVSKQLIDVITIDSDSLLDLPSLTTTVPNLIPEEFRPFIPTKIISHIIEGAAAQPALALGEFEHSERQLTPQYKEVRSTTLGTVTLPITHTNKETTTQFGGGDVDRNITLELTGTGTLDEGLFVLSSSIKDLGNGMEIKESSILDTGSQPWPALGSFLWDENMRETYFEFQQVVDPTTIPDPDPGTYYGFTSEVKLIDKWRSKKTNIAKPAPDYIDPGSALITYDYRPFKFPGYLYFIPQNGAYYVRAAHADLCQQTIRTWWVNSDNPPPTPAVDEIIMDNPIINTLNSLSTLTYAGECLHDAITTFGAFMYPATTPSGTEYHLGIPDGTFTNVGVASIANPGSGYVIGGSGSFSGDGNFVTIQITQVGVSNSITAFSVTSSTFAMAGGPYMLSGGGGTGAEFNVLIFTIPNYIPGTAWIGTERVIAANVTPEREHNLWKIQTRSVVMR